MKNVTHLMLKAIHANIDWSVNRFYSFIDDIKELGINVSYSDGEEYWATMGYNNHLIGYIWKSNPLIFLKDEYISLLQRVIDGSNFIVLITVRDLSSEELVVNLEPELSDRLRNIDYNKPTSADDIWINSVT